MARFRGQDMCVEFREAPVRCVFRVCCYDVCKLAWYEASCFWVWSVFVYGSTWGLVGLGICRGLCLLGLGEGWLGLLGLGEAWWGLMGVSSAWWDTQADE